MTLVDEPEVPPEEADRHPDPVAAATHLRAPVRARMAERFGPTDPPKGWDLAAHPKVARILHDRKFQFALILPNQIIFWMVIFIGVLGTAVPGLNFGTAITWYLWFCLVFVMMVVVGRAWCVMCPFGGFAEWIQRGGLWTRAQRSLGLGRKMPESLAQYGFLYSVGTFLLLTWIEEYFNIAVPGDPLATSLMVFGIVGGALVFFLVFERRTFCRYFCPLTALIGTVGAAGSVAGFRTRDRDVCVNCKTKDCMRGGVNGYACPWYTWPGSADSNLACGLCSECYKGCPQDNIGLYLQKPLTSVIAPTRRRADVAWAVAVLWGLVLFQQLNYTGTYATVDNWLNKVIGPGYPNPVDYIGIIAAVALIMAAVAKLAELVLARRDLSPVTPGGVSLALGSSPASLGGSGSSLPSGSSSAAAARLTRRGAPAQKANFLDRTSRFRMYFLPLMYGIIPVVGADYFARQLPKLLKHLPRLIPSIEHIVGFGSTSSALYHSRLMSNPGIVDVQVAVIAIGTLASMWASWQIAKRELVGISRNPVAARALALALPLACGVAAAVMYVIMRAAS